MFEKLEKNFFPQRCALKAPAKSQDSAGQEIHTHSVHQGYESIPCRVGAAGGGQRRGLTVEKCRNHGATSLM